MDKTHWQVLGILTVLLMTRMLAPAQDAAPAKARRAFLNEIAEAHKTQREKLARMNKIYADSLAKLAKKAQSDGDLDALVALQTEKKRFAKEEAVAKSDLSNGSPELRKLQQSFISSRERAVLDGAKAIVAVADGYSAALGKLQAKLTRDGNVEAALSVKKERTGLADHPDVSAAKFAVADAEWHKRPKGPPPSRTVKPSQKPPATVTTPAEREAAVRKRHRTFYQALGMRSIGTAMRFVRPEDVRLKRPSVTTRLRQIVDMVSTLKKVGLTQHLTDPPQVNISGSKTAIVPTPFVQTSRYGVRRNPPGRWVLEDGEWYIDVFTY